RAVRRAFARRSNRGLRLQQAGGVIGRDATFSQLAEDLLAALGLAIGLGLGREAERADHRVQPRPHRRVRDAELALDVLEVAARADEDFEEFELFRREAVEPAEGERALKARPTALAFEAHDLELLGADGASRDDRICHESKMRPT